MPVWAVEVMIFLRLERCGLPQIQSAVVKTPLPIDPLSVAFRWSLLYARVSNLQCLRHRLLVCPASFDKRAPIIPECYDPLCCCKGATVQRIRHQVAVALAMEVGEGAQIFR